MISKRKFPFPWLTLGVSLLSCAMFGFLIYNTHEIKLTADFLSKMGAPSAIEIYDGQYWGVLWNSFIHSRYDIFIINILGLWILGAFIERRLKIYQYFLLGLFASLTTSTIQLALSNDPGIGLSGINYLMFFYILGRSWKDELFRLKFKLPIAIVLLSILTYCFYQNIYNGWQMGTASMTSGMLIGLLIGIIVSFRRKILGFTLMLLISVTLISTLFYAPWSAEWNTTIALRYHNNNKTEIAKKYYRRALKINPEDKTARENLFIIKIDGLSDLAYKCHEANEYEQALIYYEQILALNPSNIWAKEQIKKLP